MRRTSDPAGSDDPAGPSAARLHPLRAAFVALILAGSALQAAAQNADAGKAKAAACARCHGADGNSTDPQFPILAGQTARYIYLQLRDIKEGRRTVEQMQPVVPNLTREDMLDLAAYFSSQKTHYTGFKPDAAKADRGHKKAQETLCTMCHLGGFMGQNEIPRVAGQYYAYIFKELQDFKAGRRTNDAGNMASVSKTLSEQDMDDLANYLAGLY